MLPMVPEAYKFWSGHKYTYNLPHNLFIKYNLTIFLFKELATSFTITYELQSCLIHEVIYSHFQESHAMHLKQ